MPRPRNEAAKIAERRARVAALYLRGRSQREIGAEVGVDHGTVCRDLQALHKDWCENARGDVGERKARELAKIDNLEAEAWAAWERSKQDAEIRHVRIEGKAGEEKTVKEQTTKGQAGDPRFLERVAWCIDRRCQLLGLDAPKKLEHGGKDGKPIEQVVFFIPENHRDQSHGDPPPAGAPDAVPG